MRHVFGKKKGVKTGCHRYLVKHLFLERSVFLLGYFLFLAIQNIRMDFGFSIKGTSSLWQNHFHRVGCTQFEILVIKGYTTSTDIHRIEARTSHLEDDRVLLGRINSE